MEKAAKMPILQRIWYSISQKILRLEHIIYCRTNCRFEGLIHKSVYDYRKNRYNRYIKTHHPEWFD